jgi:tRNA/rRNA methyltransferase
VEERVMRPGDAGGDNTRDFTVPPVLRMHTRFVLIQTSHAGNVGGVARAMKVMGFDDLVLVQPRWANVLRREETIQRASGANDVLAKARIVDTLDEALDGMSHLCATAMTPRDFGPPTRAPREHFAAVLGEQEPPQGVAFLFGSERFGMRNEDVYRCHVALSIPTAPGFGSLNLAAAVQLVAYDWRQALGGFEAPAEAQPRPAPWPACWTTWSRRWWRSIFWTPRPPRNSCRASTSFSTGPRPAKKKSTFFEVSPRRCC